MRRLMTGLFVLALPLLAVGLGSVASQPGSSDSERTNPDYRGRFVFTRIR